MLNMPTIFWTVVLILITLVYAIGLLLLMLARLKFKSCLGGVYGVAFIWMLLNVESLNQRGLIEIGIAVVSIYPLLILFSPREIEAINERILLTGKDPSGAHPLREPKVKEE